MLSSLKMLKVFVGSLRYSIAIGIGFLLAISLVSGVVYGTGELFSISFKRSLEKVHYDASIDFWGVDWSEAVALVDFLSKKPYVESLEYVVRCYDVVAYFDNESIPVEMYFVNGSFFEERGVVLSEGELPEGVNEVLVCFSETSSVEVEANDSLVLSFFSGEVRRNSTFAVSGVAQLSEKALAVLEGMPLYRFPEYAVGEARTVLLARYDAYSRLVQEGVLGDNSPASSSIVVFLDRDEVINVYSLDETAENLNEIEEDLMTISAPYGASVEFPLKRALEVSIGTIRAFQSLLIVIGIPMFILCAYLSYSAARMLVHHKRREIGLVRARGCSKGAIFRSLILGVALVGVAGSLAGTILGSLSGSLLAAFLTEEFQGVKLYAPTPYDAAVFVFFGLFLAIMASYGPAKQASEVPPVEVSRYYSERLEEDRKVGKVLLFLTAVSTVQMVAWCLEINPYELLGAVRGNPLLMVLLGLYAFFESILMLLAPFFFSYGLTTIIMKGQTRLYKITTSILKPLLGDLAPLVSKSISRSPARVARVAVLIALIFTYVTWPLLTAHSAIAYFGTLERIRVGGDVNAEIHVLSFLPTYASWVENHSRDISSYTFAFKHYSNVKFSRDVYLDHLGPYKVEYSFNVAKVEGSYVIPIFGEVCFLNLSSYQSTVYEISGLSEPAELRELLNSMSENSSRVLVSRTLAERVGIELGDVLSLSVSFSIPGYGVVEERTVFCEVVGFFSVLPGVFKFEGEQALIVSSELAADLLNAMLEMEAVASLFSSAFESATLILKLKELPADELVASLEELSYASVSYLQEVVEEKGITFQNMLFYLVRAFYVYVVYGMVLAFVGLLLVSFSSAYARIKEVSLMKARGLSLVQSIKLLLGETFSVALLSIAVGVATGLVTARGYLTLIYSSYAHQVPVKASLAIPLEFWQLLLASITLLLVASTVPALLVSKKRVVEVMRVG